MEVLPDPEGPIKARISPGAALPDMPLRMVFFAEEEEEWEAPFVLLCWWMLPRSRPLTKDVMNNIVCKR